MIIDLGTVKTATKGDIVQNQFEVGVGFNRRQL